MTIRATALAAVTALIVPHVGMADEPMPVEQGEKAPDFTVTGIDGKPFRLSGRIGHDDGNIVLLFSRAHW